MSAAQQKRNKDLAVQLAQAHAECDRLRELLRLAKMEVLHLVTDKAAKDVEINRIHDGVGFW